MREASRSQMRLRIVHDSVLPGHLFVLKIIIRVDELSGRIVDQQSLASELFLWRGLPAISQTIADR